ncbi:hypothetical protein [Actinoplanes sp. TFC3]|uniref:hypothetical protein n=1 Tax=Actinoplanes sp. TFC3 TaxID=1710355 RepID=UPI0008302487|nr:hypothetical protein [Actinoplanes sp. TFC3]
MSYGPVFVPSRRPAATERWRGSRCDEVVLPAVRDALWEFTREVHNLEPGPAKLSGLNDTREAEAKIGMLGTDTAPLCLVLRAHLPGPPAARKHWREDLGTQGVRPQAAQVTGIDQVDPDQVAPLLTEPPSQHVRPWLILRSPAGFAAGALSVDPGDGLPRRVIDFAVLHLNRPGAAGERPPRCPHCNQPRVRRYAAFDLCPDCGWFAT